MTSVTLKLCHIGPDGVIMCFKPLKKNQSGFNVHIASDKFQQSESLA